MAGDRAQSTDRQDPELGGMGVSESDGQEAGDGVSHPTDRPTVEVRVTIRRTADVERDKRLLTWVYDLLRAQPGPDRFCVILRIPAQSGGQGNGSAVQLDFPNDSTTYDAALERQLIWRLGAGSVEVRSLEG